MYIHQIIGNRIFVWLSLCLAFSFIIIVEVPWLYSSLWLQTFPHSENTSLLCCCELSFDDDEISSFCSCFTRDRIHESEEVTVHTSEGEGHYKYVTLWTDQQVGVIPSDGFIICPKASFFWLWWLNSKVNVNLKQIAYLFMQSKLYCGSEFVLRHHNNKRK